MTRYADQILNDYKNLLLAGMLDSEDLTEALDQINDELYRSGVIDGVASIEELLLCL